MRIRLPESDRAPQRNRAGTAVSVAAHAALILLAVQATAGGAPPADAPPEPARVIYHVRPVPPTPVASAAAATSPRAAAATLPPAPRLVPSELPPVLAVGSLPDLALPLPRGATVGADDFRGAVPGALGTSGAAPATTGGPLAAHLVDVPARPADRTTPRYPDLLRRSSTEGSVLVRFVVDSAGRVERGSVTVLEATHPLFAAAVRDALLRARFRAAEVAGRPVAQLVEQRFEFRLDR
jgi:TonB family protein